MRSFLVTFLLALLSFTAYSQDSSVHTSLPPAFERNTTILTASFGLGNWYKSNYNLPDGFKYGSASASVPVYLKLERAVSNTISIAACIDYNAFHYAYNKEFFFNGMNQYRNYTDMFSVLSAGPEVYYHFNKFINVHNLDVFIGIGGTINFINHTNYPSADTTASQIKTTFSPVVRVGARYYVTSNSSFFGDIGYDKMSLLSLGFSYRFLPKAVR